MNKNKMPPKWANRFLEWYCADNLLDEIQGDLLEAYYYRKEEVGSGKAKWWFIWDVLRFFRPSSFKKKSINSNALFMLKNNIKIALRIINRRKWASFINIFSLTLGITAVALISIFVVDELSFDKHHENKESIHRIITDYYSPEGEYNYTGASHPLPMAKELITDFSEISAITRIADDSRYVRTDGAAQQEDAVFVDNSFFQMFSFPFVVGDEKSALQFSKNVVITRQMAEKYFQSVDVLGETIEIRQDEEFSAYLITGVVERIPTNSSIQFDMAMSYDQVEYYSWAANSWGVRIDEVFIQLSENVDINEFNTKLKDQWKKYLPDAVEESKSFKGDYQNYKLQALTDVHLASDIGSSLSTGDPSESYILSIIAVIILLIGSANFTILSMGRSTLRGKEIAIKKVIGAKRGQLIRQFWTEAITLSVLAMLLSIALMGLLLPSFNLLADKNYQLNDIINLRLLILLPSIALLTGLVAGAYPSLVLSGISILDFFRKKLKLGGSNLFTKSLITVQFSLSIMLLLGSFVVFEQIQYFKVKDLGYDPTNVIVLENNLNTDPEKLKVYKNLLAANPDISGVTSINSSFSRGGFSSVLDKSDGTKMTYSMYFVEPSFFEVMDIPFNEGRNFNVGSAADSNSVIMNEQFRRAFGDDYLLDGNIQNYRNAGLKNPKMIGVTKDFHFQSLARELRPVLLVLGLSERTYENLLIKANKPVNAEMVTFLQDSWYEIAPDAPFKFNLMSDELSAQYAAQERWFAIVKYATIWALGLATLGLIGIVSISITGRLKEVSIRKVLGANSYQLYLILSRQFLFLLILASIIAVPLTIHFASDWLDNFAYHITLNPFVFAGVILFVFCLIIGIVFVGTSKTLRSNPVKALRME
ncbi:ABC transporter permease [Roseivirga sp.]|uniref:ABC transporter permease n=1 Tax=Roseivirga sp. TaxID=1964215 RepID=UPI003B8C7266